MTKRFFKQMILMAAVLLMGFSSCISENIPIPSPGDEGGYKLMALRMSSNQPAGTRGGESDYVAHGQDVNFVDGHLYFVSSVGTILRGYTISRTLPTDTTSLVLNFYDLHVSSPGSVPPLRVPAATRSLVIAGNVHGRAIAAQGTPIADVNSTPISVSDQEDAEDVNIWYRYQLDMSSYTWVPGAGGQMIRQFDAHLRLYPTLARIQVGRITGVQDIHSFTLEGIFIDYFYQEARVDGNIPPFLGTPPTTTPNLVGLRYDPDYFLWGSSLWFGNHELYQWYVSGLESNAATYVVPAGWTAPQTIVWGFNVFATRGIGTFPFTNAGTRVPRIILRFSEVYVYDEDGEPAQLVCDDGNETYFLTVRGFYGGTAPNLTRLQGIHARHVYHIGNLEFDSDDIDRYPNRNPIAVRVTVSNTQWNQEQVVIAGFRQSNPSSFAVNANTTFTINLAPAVRNGSSLGLEYMWQREECMTVSPYTCEWVNIGSWTTASNLTVTGGIPAQTRYRRIARVIGSESVSMPLGIHIITAPATISLLNLDTPDISTIPASGGGTDNNRFCNTVTIVLSKPSSWDPADWDNLTAANITVQPTGAAGWVRGALSAAATPGGDREFTLMAATTPANASHTLAINFTGAIGGIDLMPRDADKVVIVDRITPPSVPLTVSGQNCFNVAYDTAHVASNFSTPVVYSLNTGVTNGVPATATVLWNVNVGGGGTLTESQIINATAISTSPHTLTVTLNPTLASNPLLAAQIASEDVVITITATATWATPGGCVMSMTAARVVTIGNIPCCIPIGTGAGFACWALYNLYHYNEFVDSWWDRGHFFQWGSRVAWTAPQHPNTTAAIQRWNVGATAWSGTVAWANNLFLAGNPPAWDPDIHDPCPAGWQLPTSAQLQGLGQGTWHANWSHGGTGRGPGRVFPAGAGVVGVDQIFLPAAGNRATAGSLGSVGAWGFFWSSTPSGTSALVLFFDSGGTSVFAANRAQAFSVRCVADP